MTMTWFRLYHDLPNDRKLRRFSPQQKWAWVVILCLASENKERGQVTGEDDSDVADYCGFECVQDYLYFLDKLRQKDMITPIEGGFKITHWDDRQYTKPSDKPEATKIRKQRQREKEKAKKEEVSRVTQRDECVMSRHTDADPDSEQIQNSDLDHTHNPDLRVRDFETTPEQEPTVVAPAAYVSPPVTVTRKEIQFTSDPIADRFSAGGRLPDWRTGRGVNGLRQDFVEWLAKSYLAKLPCYKEQPAPSMADARSWIVSREKGNTELIEIQWLAFSDRGAQTVAKTSAAYDWSRDTRLSDWTALANSMNNYRFCYPDGVRDEERVAFYQWLEKQEVRSA